MSSSATPPSLDYSGYEDFIEDNQGMGHFSQEINEYLRDTCGQKFSSATDFKNSNSQHGNKMDAKKIALDPIMEDIPHMFHPQIVDKWVCESAYLLADAYRPIRYVMRDEKDLERSKKMVEKSSKFIQKHFPDFHERSRALSPQTIHYVVTTRTLGRKKHHPRSPTKSNAILHVRSYEEDALQ